MQTGDCRIKSERQYINLKQNPNSLIKQQTIQKEIAVLPLVILQPLHKEIFISSLHPNALFVKP